MKTIYDLSLHECLYDIEGAQGRMMAMRVPGGWVYTVFSEGVGHPCFVPYSAEFRPKVEKEEDIQF